MTDTTPNLKIKALDLANQFASENATAIVARATVYYNFLSGTAAAPAANKPAGATGAPAAGKPPAAGGKPGATPAAGKPGATPAAGKTPPAAAKTPAAGKAPTTPKAGAANAQAVPGDTKAPGGKNTYQDVVNALVKIRDKPGLGKERALAILSEDGGGVKSVRDLKPALYDVVVEACDGELSGEGGDDGEGGNQTADAGADFDDGTGGAQGDPSDIG